MRRRVLRMISRAVVGGAVLGGVVGVGGCAGKGGAAGRGKAVVEAGAATGPTTRQAKREGIAWMAYEEIEPKLALRSGGEATTRGAGGGDAPVEAVEAYARARAAMIDGRRLAAMQLLERAAELDKGSAEVRRMLARAYLDAEGGTTGLEKAADALRGAVEIEPDDGESWLRLGQIETARDRRAEGLRALRMAALTTAYKERAELAAAVDLNLARALSAAGYDRAALERYQRVLAFIGGEKGPPGPGALREAPELVMAAQRPEGLYLEVGRIYERSGQYDEAARIYGAAAERDDDSFEITSRWARALAQAGEAQRAVEVAGGAVVRMRADERSMGLLADVYKQVGREGELLAELERLQSQRPGDVSLLLALAEGLRRQGRADRAETLLDRALREERPSADDHSGGGSRALVLGRLADLRMERGDLAGAARAVIRAAASSPGNVQTYARIMTSLTRPSRDGRLRLRALMELDVGDEPRVKAARDYFAARLAQSLGRTQIARERMALAAEHFEPAVIGRAEEVLLSVGTPGEVASKRYQEVLEQARKLGGEPLAQAVEGRRLMLGGDARRAARALSAALAGGQRDLMTQVYLGRMLRRAGENALAERTLVEAAAGAPGEDAGQSALVALYIDTGRLQLAARTAAEWARSAPASGEALSASALLSQQTARDPDEAVRSAKRVLELAPDDETSVEGAEAVMQRAGQGGGDAGQGGGGGGGGGGAGGWEVAVAEAFEKSPRALPLLRRVVSMAAAAGRRSDAEAAIERARKAAADDADLLYFISDAARDGELTTLARAVLAEAVKVDPTHVGAANDYAYEVADAPQARAAELEECERLARAAVAADPENASFLDTLGWVLYKRGDFAGAAEWLEKAEALSVGNKAVVLDHLGDARWRAGKKDAARQAWRTALGALERGGQSAEPEVVLRLRKKLEMSDQGREPPTARVPE